jgi:hypothetical protein
MKNLFTILFIVMNLTYGYSQTYKEVLYQDNSQKLKGLALLSSSSAEAPGVLILPAWKGIDQEAKDAAVALNKRRKHSTGQCNCGQTGGSV